MQEYRQKRKGSGQNPQHQDQGQLLYKITKQSYFTESASFYQYKPQQQIYNSLKSKQRLLHALEKQIIGKPDQCLTKI
jgi:hypothetical protein